MSHQLQRTTNLTSASLPPAGTGAIPAPVPTGGNPGSSGRRVVSTNGQRSRRVGPEEIEISDEWETSMSCDPSSAGQRTNSTQAKMEMEISTDVAGMTIASQSSSSEGELKLSLGGVEVAKEEVEQWKPQDGGGGISTGCEVTYKWSREASLGDLSQKLEISWTWPLVQRRQEGGQWGQINQIVVFGDKDALKQVTLGKSYDPDNDNGSSAVPSGSSAAGSAAAGSSQAAPPETSASASGNTSVPEKQSARPAPEGPSSGARGTWTKGWGVLVALGLGAVFA